MFYELRYQVEQEDGKKVSLEERDAIEQFLQRNNGIILQYA